MIGKLRGGMKMIRRLSFLLIVSGVVVLFYSPAIRAQSKDIQSIKTERDLLLKKVSLLQQRIKLLEQENKYLQSKLESLSSKRTATTSKRHPRISTPQPGKKEPQIGTSTEEGFQITLHEYSSQWWVNPDTLFFELSLRDFIAERYPEQSVPAWLARRKGFANQQITWQMRVRSIRDISALAARRGYLNAVERVKSAEKRLAQYKKQAEERKTPPGERQRRRYRTSESYHVRESIRIQAELNEARANVALWQQLDRARGGAIVELEPTQGEGQYRLTVNMPVVGDDALKLANMKRSTLVELSGKILSTWTSGRRLYIVATGKLTQMKEPEKTKPKRGKYRRERRYRPRGGMEHEGRRYEEFEREHIRER